MKKLYSLFVFGLLAGVNLFGQGPLYSKAYFNPNYSADAKSLCKSFNSGTILVGYSGYGGSISEIDSAGIPVWHLDYRNTYLFNITQTSDSNYIIVGTASDSLLLKEGVICLKVNRAGNLIWSQFYADTTSNSFGYCGFKIKPTLDQAYVMCGEIANNGLIMKIDSAGNILWSHSLASNGTGVYLYDIKQNADSSFLITGSVNGNSHQSIFAKLDNQGNVLWLKSYFSIANTESEAFSVETLSDGYMLNLLVQGGTTIMKTDTVGNPLWSRIIGGGSVSFGPYSHLEKIHLLSDNTVLWPTSNSSNAYGDQRLIKIDLNGNFLLEKTIYASPIDFYENPDKSIVLLSDGPLNLVQPYSTVDPTISIMHIDSTLGDTIGHNAFCLVPILYNFQADSTLLSEHSIPFSITDSVLLQYPIFLPLDTLSLMSMDGCMGLTGSIHELEYETLNIFPNPASDQFTIYSEQLNGENNIRIYDFSGRMVYKEHASFADGRYVIKTDLPPRVYFVQVENSRTIHRAKLLILH
ncbi:MAG: T9SS type A sorting domain-containing protein [Bacteroidetes bacterium]|nr:T9SS type A sorting domain-containing protein [Bacteroidota bacterium]